MPDPITYITTDTELTSVADAIRTKGSTSASLVWPSGYISAINDIPTGGGGPNGPFIEFDEYGVKHFSGSTFYKSAMAQMQFSPNFNTDDFSTLINVNDNLFYGAIIDQSGITFQNAVTIGSSAFGMLSMYVNHNSQISECIFPNVVSIGSSAFYWFGYYASLPAGGTTPTAVPCCDSFYFGSLSEINNDAVFNLCAIKKVTSEEFPNLYSIRGSGAFQGCSRISIIDLPKLTYLSASNLFTNVSRVSYIGFSSLSEISNVYSMFGTVSNDNCSIVSLPKLKKIYEGNGFITRMSALETLYTPELEEICCSYAFSALGSGGNLSVLSFPKLRYISGANAFYGNSFNEGYFPLLSQISGGGCFGYTKISDLNFLSALERISGATTFYYGQFETISLPNLSEIYLGTGTFSNCYYMREAYLPLLTQFASGTLSSPYIFANCSSLEKIDLPQITIISGSRAFYSCLKLSTINFGSNISLISGSSMFYYCSELASMYISASSLCRLGTMSTTTFGPLSPITGGYTSKYKRGYVYVPESLRSTYATATNWTGISARIFPYEGVFGPYSQYGIIDRNYWSEIVNVSANYSSVVPFLNGYLTDIWLNGDGYSWGGGYAAEVDGSVYYLGVTEQPSTETTIGAAAYNSSIYWDPLPITIYRSTQEYLDRGNNFIKLLTKDSSPVNIKIFGVKSYYQSSVHLYPNLYISSVSHTDNFWGWVAYYLSSVSTSFDPEVDWDYVLAKTVSQVSVGRIGGPYMSFSNLAGWCFAMEPGYESRPLYSISGIRTIGDVSFYGWANFSGASHPIFIPTGDKGGAITFDFVDYDTN